MNSLNRFMAGLDASERTILATLQEITMGQPVERTDSIKAIKDLAGATPETAADMLRIGFGRELDHYLDKHPDATFTDVYLHYREMIAGMMK